MKKFLFLFSMIFMTCSTVNVTLKAESLNEAFISALAKTANHISKNIFLYPAKAGKFVLRQVAEFAAYPAIHGFYMLSDIKKAICEKSGEAAWKAFFEGACITLWVAAAILAIHGATYAAQYLAGKGIIGMQTLAGFELVDKYAFLNPYFQYIVGLYKKIPGLPRHVISGFVCGLPCAAASYLA